MSTVQPVETAQRRPRLATFIRNFSPLVIVVWLAILILVSLAVPPLEVVERERSVSLTPTDAPSFIAAERMGRVFQESTGGAVAVIMFEGKDRLGPQAHKYYDDIVRNLKADKSHVQHVQDFWGDPLTAGAAESADGKAAYVQMELVGTVGQAQANDSVEAVRKIVNSAQAPSGVKAYVTGPAAIYADIGVSGNKTVLLITLVTVGVIFLMLLLLYRSISVVLILLFTVFVELQVARGVVAFLAQLGIVGLTTYVVNLLVSVGIAAGTDYAIFFAGRYQEARQAGEDRTDAFYTSYHGVARVVLASGVTIAGAIACLSFTRLPFFQPLGIPGAIGILVAVAVALTLVPACIAAASRFGIFDPKRAVNTRRWRRVGTVIVRWPGPILVATVALSLIGLLTLPGYRPSYNDQNYLPKGLAATDGLEAGARHFPESSRTASPDLLMIEADHDMRTSADLLVLNKLAKAVFAVPGVANVQSVTRPEGNQIKHSSIPFMLSLSNASQKLTLPFQRARMEDLVKQADQLTTLLGVMQHIYEVMQELNATTHRINVATKEISDVTYELRDSIADFDDFFRPIRAYFYFEPHCYDIPICWALRGLFDTIDGVDRVTEKMQLLNENLDQLDALMPQILAQFPATIANLEFSRQMLLTTHSTMGGILAQADESNNNSTAMGKAFDAANNDESFYLPPDIFENDDFKRVVDIFMSPDGKAARLLISQKGDPASPEGIALVEPIKNAAEEAIKGTPLESSQIYLAGTAAGTKDLVDGSKIDLLIAGVAALCLIFLIMLIMTRSLVAALVIVGTVALSLGASFGLSVLIWQDLLGIQIHWVVLAMSVIVLLAVGSDYNLLLVSRMKTELPAGIDTGLIRAMGGTGKVVTAAGLVFAATMGSLIFSDLLTLGQVGTTIALGLLFDTLIVRAFMTPSVAALLGRWFWWPQRVRPRPASSMLRPTGPRPLVRSLLLRD